MAVGKGNGSGCDTDGGYGVGDTGDDHDIEG